MSNQSVNGFQGSQPFVTDKQFQNLSLDEIRHIIAQEKEELKKDYKELGERRILIKQYKKLIAARQQVKEGIDIKKKLKKHKPPAKMVAPSKKKKIKTFDEYFEECMKNKKIPKDAPSYLREALERAMKEYDKGLEKEKSALEGFANKNTIQGIPSLTPMDFFEEINETLRDFFTYHRNIKFRLLLVCIMEKQNIQQNVGVLGLEEGKAYFSSGTLYNLKLDDVDKLIELSIDGVDGSIEAYQAVGSGWYFKEVDRLEIYTVEFNPAKGSSYISLPGWISNKKAIVNIQNKDEKCFLWCILRYLYPKESHEERVKDLKKYEFSLNTKGINFPMKLKDITKFEKLNPELPGINVFSDDNMIFYPLRMADKDCKNTIDLFLYEEDGVSHYTLIKDFNRLIKSQNTSSKNGKIFICKKCFTHFTKEEL